MRFLNTLYARISAALFAILLVVGLIFFLIGRLGTDLYYKEVTQRLNRDLSVHIANEGPLISGGQPNAELMKALAHFAMVINPSVEVYLLDRDGEILAHAAPPERVKRTRVDLTPIARFLQGPTRLPLVGEDPRDPAGMKIFSAAPVTDGGDLAGYVYVILGGEQYDALASSVRGSYIRNLSVGVIAITLLFAVIAGLFLFSLLTRRLRLLSEHVETLSANNFRPVPDYPVETVNGDEIDRLGATFNAMSHRIAEQVTRLEKTDSLRRELISNVSHDLRTPLASMQGYIETLLLKDKTLSDEERRQYLEIARGHSQQLARLVSELFELAKLDSGNVQPHLETFALAELLQDVGQEFRLAAEDRQLSLQIDAPVADTVVNADIGLIQRVLENLIENAIRHTPAGGIVHVGLQKEDHRYRITVSDTGCGIDAEALPHIFDRFYGSKDHGDSTGLGLAIVKRIVDLHGGDVTVESRRETGTRFTVGLPVDAAA